MLRPIVAICLLFFLFSCEKKTEIYQVDEVSEYYPLQIGKYIEYQLDSTLFINFGQQKVVVTYLIKDVVDAQVVDNLGRPSYRVLRYIRKNSSENWLPSFAYLVTDADNKLELVENDLRYIKLINPVRQDVSWKGNSHIDTYTTDLNFRFLDDWDYIYDSVGVPIEINGMEFENTVKVFQRDEFLGQDPDIPGTQYAEKNFAYEKYAKGVGLIYREFLHWEYQGAQPGRDAYYEGYGIKLTITGHN
ncbi:MAG: hypothetical protein J5I50_10205 [Chitinophagaceae bacterium]|nr:hypothetical protein [Chitinophagaceae bacterium]